MKTHNISNSDDVIDSRDVIARIEELRDERDEYNVPLDDDTNDERAKEWAAENPDDAEELAALESLAEEAESYAEDRKYGSALVRDTYFTKHCKDFCIELGYLPKDVPSFIEIDWDATAENLKADYTSVDFDGVTYWIR